MLSEAPTKPGYFKSRPGEAASRPPRLRECQLPESLAIREYFIQLHGLTASPIGKRANKQETRPWPHQEPATAHDVEGSCNVASGPIPGPNGPPSLPTSLVWGCPSEMDALNGMSGIAADLQHCRRKADEALVSHNRG